MQTDCLMEVAAGTADAAVLDLTLANAMIGEGTDYEMCIRDSDRFLKNCYDVCSEPKNHAGGSACKARKIKK